MDKVQQRRQFSIYLVSLLIFIALGVVAILWSSRADFQITSNYLGNNSLASQTTTVFTAATRVLWSVQYRQILLIFIVFVLFLPVIFIRFKLNPQIKDVETDYINWKAADRAISAGFLSFFALENSGMQDILSLTFVLISVLSVFGLLYLAETRQQSNPEFAQQMKMIADWLFILPCLAVLVVIGGTWLFGMIHSPWYVYVMDGLALAYIAHSLYLPSSDRIKKLKKSNLLLSSTSYAVVDQVIKAAFIFILIFSIHK